MAENNVIYTVVTPDVPKAIPGEQLYVYVPRASFTNPGIAAFDSTQFTIDANGIVSIKNEYVTQNEFNKAQFVISETGGVSIKDDYVKGVMQPTVKLLNDAVETANTTAGEAKTIAGRAESKADAAVATANGIDSKATQALTKATDAEEQVDGKLDKSAIVQGMGNATDKVISQKVVTDALDTKLTIATGVHGYDQVYGITANGSQELFNVSDKVTTGAIVRRKNNGQIVALEATTNDGVVNLGQLTTKLLDYLLKSGGIISGNLSIQGDLEVRGTTKTTEEETLNVKDSIVVTNSSEADLSATLAGFVIRLNATDCYGIIYDASSESVKLGLGKITNGKFTFNSGEGNAVAVRADGSLMTNGHLVKWDATALKFVDAGKSVDDFVQKTSTKGLYATEVDGRDVKINFSASPVNWQIVQYDDGGRIQTNDPKDPLDAVNKRYFEAKGWLLRGGTSIPENADLNDYTTPGNYYCETNVAAATIKNSPAEQAFTLKVFYDTGTGYPSQLLIEHYNLNVYMRYLGTPIGNWKKVATEEQLENYLSKTGITSQAGLTITQTSSGVQVDSAVLIDNSLLGG